jgi:hypothetical protein
MLEECVGNLEISAKAIDDMIMQIEKDEQNISDLEQGSTSSMDIRAGGTGGQK